MPPVPPPQQADGGGKANPNSRTSSTTMSQMTGNEFAQLPLSAPTQRAIAEVLRYKTLTKVQNDSIPPALAGKILVGFSFIFFLVVALVLVFAPLSFFFVWFWLYARTSLRIFVVVNR